MSKYLIPSPIVVMALFLTTAMTIKTADAAYYDVVSYADCADKVKAEPNLQCMSFFYIDGGTGDCAISSKDDKRGPCEPNPCHFDGECDENGEDFICKCPVPMTGKSCEELSCAPNCFRRGTMVLYTDPNPVQNWDAAHKYCADHGWQMIADRSWTEHGFIYGSLNTLLKSPDEKIGVWLALRRDSPSGTYHYENGDELENDAFTLWDPSSQRDQFTSIALRSTEQFQWVDASLDSPPGYTFYPFCEATYDELSHY